MEEAAVSVEITGTLMPGSAALMLFSPWVEAERMWPGEPRRQIRRLMAVLPARLISVQHIQARWETSYWFSRTFFFMFSLSLSLPIERLRPPADLGWLAELFSVFNYSSSDRLSYTSFWSELLYRHKVVSICLAASVEILSLKASVGGGLQGKG